MTQLRWSEVEEWLDAHPDLFQDYFLRKTELGSINAWLVNHGFLTIQDYARRGSVSPQPGDEPPGQRRPSRRCLRHEFARSKSRSVFRTHETAPPPSAIPTSRRSSLKDMRKYCSLPPNSIHMLSLLIESKVRLPDYGPTHSRSAKREVLRTQGDREFFLTIVRDVATELDPKTLSAKVVDNLAVLLDADGASLFLVDGPVGKRTLVSKVFDVHSGVFLLPGGNSDNEVQVPWGVGVLGHVAETGETVNLQIACEDPRFDDEVDRIMGYHTESLLCMAVRNSHDEIIAVAQVINKNPDKDNGHFTNKDEKLFETYLQFVGIALTNAQIVETSRQEYERNRNLLEIVHDLFEEQTSLEKVVLKIMQRAQRLLKCERAAVLLVDDTNPHEGVKFSKLFELTSPANGHNSNNRARVYFKRAGHPHIVRSEPYLRGFSSPLGTITTFTPLKACEVFLSIRGPLEPDKCLEWWGHGGIRPGLRQLRHRLSKRRIEVGGPGLSGYLLTLAEKVAESGEVLNVVDCLEVEPNPGISLRSLLAMPIRNSTYQIIGVATIINKTSGHPFDENDEQLFEAFTIFCGLGIHNTIMYSEVEKAMARQKVTIEVLSYHATATKKEIDSLLDLPVPAADEWNLYSLSFDDFSLNEEEMILASVSMFLELGLVKKFSIERETLYRFLMTVKKNYRDVPYHNWRHAFNVAQVMFAILMGCEMKGTFSDLEVLGMFVGCLCHDLDHRGTNNAFQQKAGSALVLLYGTTNTMEHHHFNHAVMILSSETLNIFSSLSAENYSYVMKILKHSILATDLSTYFQNRSKFFSLVERREYSWCQEEHRMLLCSVLMTASDIACSCKPWPVQKKVAYLVADEFLSQGDKEKKELKIQPIALMDRERAHELPQLQLKWIVDICLPLYQCLGTMNPKLNLMTEGAKENIKNWAALAEKLNKENEEYINNENKCSS